MSDVTKTEASAVGDFGQFKQLVAEESRTSLDRLLAKFPQIRSLALLVDWDDALPGETFMVKGQQPITREDLLRLLQRCAAAQIALLETILVKGEVKRGEGQTGGTPRV